MAAKDSKFRTLKLFLIKDGIDINHMLTITPITHDCNRELPEINQDIKIDISEYVNDDNHYFLVLKKPKFKSPAWGDLFPTTLRENYVEKLFTSSASALLIIVTSVRSYAIAFGHGRHILKPDSYERDFGLKVVLNSVDPKLIRSIDTDSIDDYVFHATKQSSKASTLESYELRPTQEILRGVAGVPKKKFGKIKVKFVAGADVLSLNTNVGFNKLGDLCSIIMQVYRETSYKERFGFIDNLRIEKDSAIVNALNDRLIEKMNELKVRDDEEDDSITVAPPDVINFKDIEDVAFNSIYTSIGDNEQADQIELRIIDWIRRLTRGITLNMVKSEKVGVKYNNEYSPRWSLYDCLVYQDVYDGRQFVLSNGLWYCIDDDIATQVDDYVCSLIENGFSLIDANPGEHEKDYNKRLVDSNKQVYTLMDRKNIKYSNSVVEFCDVIYKDAVLNFIHVKRKTQSATLSHLFSQGRISAKLFKGSDEFRIKVAVKIPKKSVSKLINIHGAVDAAKYKIVYAIVTKANPIWPRSLPFFSKLNLKNAAEELYLMGFQVSLVRINQL